MFAKNIRQLAKLAFLLAGLSCSHAFVHQSKTTAVVPNVHSSRISNRLPQTPSLFQDQTAPSFSNNKSQLYAAKSKASKAAMSTTLLVSLKTSLTAFLLRVSKELQALNTFQRCLFGAIFVLGVCFGKSNSLSIRRYKEAVDIPSKYFGPKAPCLTGRVVSVSDGDTLRFYHTPTPFHKSTLTKKQKKSEHSIPIRLCTIDTPETPKFGKPGQPFGTDAKEKLQGLVENQMVQARLLSKDQYGRAVGQVFQPSPLPGVKGRCVDEIMLESGLAEVYTGMGAVYGPKGKDAYLSMESKARDAKKGIWSQGKRESAAEYKKRTK